MKRRKLKLEELNRISIEEFKGAKKIPLVVVLDNVRSQHNIGSVFRTCSAFRVAEIVLRHHPLLPTWRYTRRVRGRGLGKMALH